VHLVERALEAMAAHHLGLTVAEALPAAKVAPAPMAASEVVALPAPPAISLERLRGAGLAVSGQEPRRSRVAEEFALVQQQILRVMNAVETNAGRTAGRHVVMVTSARRGEGRSFVALNLAASIAAGSGRSVVLVDADGGATSLTDQLGLRRGPGSLAALRPQDALLPTAIPRLSVFPHGDEAAGQARRPGGAELVATMRGLAAGYPNHVLVLDAPAALASSDANALAAMVGHVIVVVQAEKTPRDLVEAALDVVQACPSLHLLLNRTHLNSSDSMAAHRESEAHAGA